MAKVLITDDVHPLLIKGLQDRDYTVDFMPEITAEETQTIIANYTGLIINSKIYCGEELLAKATQLKWISRLGSGMEVINTEQCTQRGIRYANTPEGNCNAVAEHALGLLLALMRNTVKANNEVANKQWIREENRGEELSGKSVAILGYGHTGSAFAKLLAPFHVKVLAYDKYKKGFATSSSYIVESTLDDVFNEADILSLHLPLTTETNQWINAFFLNSFKKNIYLLNTSRGKVLNTSDAIKMLDTAKLKGMALDVLENEKLFALNTSEQLILKRLTESSKIILTPHIAGWTYESKEKIATVTLQKIDAFKLFSSE
jgi:D-3-phosphoglycerate dehydrogenase